MLPQVIWGTQVPVFTDRIPIRAGLSGSHDTLANVCLIAPQTSTAVAGFSLAVRASSAHRQVECRLRLSCAGTAVTEPRFTLHVRPAIAGQRQLRHACSRTRTRVAVGVNALLV